MLAILRHVLEDPATLGGWMEAELRNFFAQRSRNAAGGGLFGGGGGGRGRGGAGGDVPVPMATFLASMSRLLNRCVYV